MQLQAPCASPLWVGVSYVYCRGCVAMLDCPTLWTCVYLVLRIEIAGPVVLERSQMAPPHTCMEISKASPTGTQHFSVSSWAGIAGLTDSEAEDILPSP